MCGRYTLTADAESLQLAFDLEVVDGWDQPRYNIAPSQVLPVITDREPRKLSFLKWGLVPSWAKDKAIGNRMINARSETAAQKPSFRSAFKRRRCLIPADGYYEWMKRDGAKQPVYIRRADREIFAFAGLWENWKQPDGGWLQTFAILTRDASDAIRPIHHRMTVIVEPEDYALWLSGRELTKQEWLPIVAGGDAIPFKHHEVARDVNRPINDNPSVILPLESHEARGLL